MVFKKTFNKGFRSGIKSDEKKQMYTKKQLDNEIKKVSNAIIRKDAESKYFELIQAASASAITWQQQTVTDVTQGDTVNQRSGDTISPTSLHFKCDIYLPATLTSALGASIRFVIVQWHPQASSAVNNSAAIFIGTIPSGYDACTQYYGVDSRKEFTILLDKVFSVSQTGEAARFYEKLIPLKRTIQYATGTTITQEDNISVYTIAQNTGVNFSWRTRLRYLDM